ncbi:MAG: hypothetical protein IH585_01280, partial [Anaerolineaceae bacterium]|nr:hypothetical protein [Anaerolineaceae bacterium]
MNNPKICPGLGLSYDPSDHRDNINPLHYCYYLSRPDTISPQHQESYCLTSNHVNCPVYLRKLKETPPEPTPIAAAEPVKQAGIAEKRSKLQPLTLVTILLSVVLVILLVLIFTTPNLTGANTSADDPNAVVSNNNPTEITPDAAYYAQLTLQAMQNGLLGTPTLQSDLIPSRTSIAFRSPTVIICSKPDDWIVYSVLEGDTM